MSLKPEVVVIGGGTGTSTLLPGLRGAADSLTAIVSTFDSGGSSEILSEEYGIPAPGDTNLCLGSMSDDPRARRLLAYRFARGVLQGHTLGNVLLTGMYEDNGGDMEKAIDVVRLAFGIRYEVMPVVRGKHTLTLKDGSAIIRRESNIGEHAIRNHDAHIKLEPPARLNPRASEAIKRSDLVVIAPGSVYTSILPCLAVGGMADALQATKAKIVAVTNLVSTPGQTDNWHVADYVEMYERYIGGGAIDRVLYNTEAPSYEQLEKYSEEGEYPVRTDPEGFRNMLAVAIGAPLVAKKVFSQDPNDRLIRRTLIRHDAAAVCRRLMAIYYE